MKEDVKLILEEKKAIKLFLWLFYIFYLAFDAFYLFIYPIYSKSKKFGIPGEGLGIWIYVFILGLLFPALYFYKKGNPYVIKYIFVVGFVLVTTVNDVIINFGTSKPFETGSIVEILFFLFSPIFVNKRYFWWASSLVIGRYVFLGLVLQNYQYIFPILVYLIIFTIAYIILIRFNSYIKSLKTAYEELRQKEKLAVIGQMAAAIGHEIRNPLASLKGFTQLQQERYPNTNEFYPIMIQEIDRINLIVNDLMYLGKPKATQFEKENIEEIIAYTLSIMKQQAQRQGVEFKTIMEGPLPQIDCDGNQLKQVFINLVKNAIEAMPNGGKIKIDLKAAKENNLLISIHDEGCGISDGDIQNLGEPFYTNKKDGTGLGLMVTNQIIKDHCGELKFHSRIGIGTEVEVVLPIAQKQNYSIKVS
jgi:signal transduction histidine kinase